MPDHAPSVEKELSLDERIALVSHYPLFSKLEKKEVQALAQLFKTQHVKPGTIIVNEGSPVDALYLIAKGAAEVTRAVTTTEQTGIVNVATLTQGDAIGLSQEGFFSQTGTRAGTVAAALSMTLLVITLHDFYRFIRRSARMPAALKDACENILLINFIKQTHIFSSLSAEQIQQIIQSKIKITIAPQTMLFKENDRAEKCYFILSGKIAVSSQGQLLAELGSSHIVGEGAFIAGGRRNADAYAVEESELFVLDQAQIKHLATSVQIEEITEKRIDELRPLPHSDVAVIHGKTPENEPTIILSSQDHKTELQLTSADFVIWQNLDGKRTLRALWKEHEAELNHMTIRDVYARTLAMANSGFLDLKKKTLLDGLIEKIRSAW